MRQIVVTAFAYDCIFLGGHEHMRKTAAGRTAILLVNIAFIAFAATAIMSAFPPQYSFSSSAPTIVGPAPNYTITTSFTVSNNGFYNVDNFYVSVGLYDSTDTLVGAVSSSTPRTVGRGETYADTVILYVTTPPGAYTLRLVVHSEFAYGLIKFSIEAPISASLP